MKNSKPPAIPEQISADVIHREVSKVEHGKAVKRILEQREKEAEYDFDHRIQPS